MIIHVDIFLKGQTFFYGFLHTKAYHLYTINTYLCFTNLKWILPNFSSNSATPNPYFVQLFDFKNV